MLFVMESPTLGFICHILLFIYIGFPYSNGQSYNLQMYHKFSHEVKEWMTWRHGLDTDDWPVEGSNEYYKALCHHDSARHGRKLADYPSLTFLAGNMTNSFSQLGFLFYTMVQVGTPNVTLLVALDTGSDLFWVPCDCQECAPTSAPYYGLDINLQTYLQTYSPSASQTSKPVTCDNTLCDLQNKCSKSSDQCPYNVAYVSANTSTSGTLVEDILYLIPGNGSLNGTVVKAPITFGCGKVQTGSFLQGAAPYGLLGLGIEPISVPNILYKSGFVSNSFSMCFPQNSTVGRFTFGDKGSSDQKETPFIIDKQHPTYYLGVKEFYVGNALVKAEFQALFDTGTSFTYLADSVYKSLTSNYHMQTQDSPLAFDDSNIPFEFCYKFSNSQSINQGPNISFNFNGGNNFSAIQPFVFIGDTTGKLVGYCLAVLHSSTITIIGQNFMAGYQLVFDRERLKLGWKEANCDDLEYSSSTASAPSSLTPLQSPLASSSVAGSPNKSYTNNSTGSPPKHSISPDALPANPNAITDDATHLSSFFLHIALSFIVTITILTVLF